MLVDSQTAPLIMEDTEAASWSAAEFAGLALGDQRLNARLIATATQLAAQPTAPINQACGDWAAAKGAYRLFQNPKVTAAEVLAPHQARTRARMRGHALVLAVQDTTYLDYTAHPQTTGLGPIGTEAQNLRGLVMHSTEVLTPAGLPLGLLTQTIWARPTAAPQTDHKQRPIEEKESYKWLQALETTVALAPAGVKVVTVCDREADVYELFVRAGELHTGLLVRAAQDRALAEPAMAQLWARVAAAAVAGELVVHVPAQDTKPARVARVTVRYRPVWLKPPRRPRQPGRPPLPRVRVTAILVQEVNPPADVTPLEWLLLTTEPVQSFADAVERVRWYRCRWQIEVFHKVLKSGCGVEHCRLDTADRLIRYLTVVSIIAWRLHWLTQLSRQQPELPCTVLLADHEWRALYATIHHTTTPPAQVPTVRQVTHWLAQLGGFLGRTGDGEPGVTVIWRGWQRLHDISSTWLLLCKETYG